MTDKTIGDVAEAWIRFETATRKRGAQRLEDSAAMSDFWAAELLMRWPAEEPERLWTAIVEVWNRLDRDDIGLVGSLGAGPVEDLLCEWGEDYLPVIEKFCEVEPDFKTALRMVWQSSMSPELWERVQQLSGGPNL